MFSSQSITKSSINFIKFFVSLPWIIFFPWDSVWPYTVYCYERQWFLLMYRHKNNSLDSYRHILQLLTQNACTHTGSHIAWTKRLILEHCNTASLFMIFTSSDLYTPTNSHYTLQTTIIASDIIVRINTSSIIVLKTNESIRHTYDQSGVWKTLSTV